jgi:hypothetical protein
MADNAEKLVSMALDRFGQLTVSEEKLFRTSANGEIADYCVGSNEDHPANVDQWGRERTLKAECIRWLCITPNVRPLLTADGLRVRGAKIEGAFQIKDATIDFRLAFSNCVFTDAISLENTDLPALEFALTHVISIYASGLRAAESVHFWNGFKAAGKVSLDAAKISGDLRCDNALFLYNKELAGGIPFNVDEREAFRAAGLEVKGFVSFSGSEVRGGVCLYQASIGGNLFCEGSRFLNKDRNALLATGAKIGGAVYLDRKFFALGQVNLEFADIGGSLNCEGGFFLHRPKIPDRAAQMTALNLECSNIKGSVYLTKWFVAVGLVNFHSANIRAHLDCRKGHFVNLGGCALLGNHARIANGVLLRDGLYAEGEVKLFAATIGGNLECSGGHFVNSPGNALDAERAEVSGHMLLNGLFRADGAVRLYATTVRGDLHCDGGQFVNPPGNALEMERANVNGHIILSDGFRAEGMVSLLRATIGGNLQCLGGAFSCPEIKASEFPPADPAFRCALQLEAANIGGSIMLRPLLKGDNTGKPFVADGTVYLLNTRVGGNVECQGCAFLKENGNALVLVAAQISGDLVLGPRFHANGSLDLSRLRVGGDCRMLDFVEAEKITSLDVRFANVTTIEHVPDSWPKTGRLLLDGLVYKNVFIGPPFRGNWKNCLEWLRLQPKEPRALQPYEQLANVLKASGYESDATEVLIAKQDDLRRYGDLNWGAKAWKHVLRFVIGYGYKPHRAFFFDDIFRGARRRSVS